jgi:hypothetical protein
MMHPAPVRLGLILFLAAMLSISAPAVAQTDLGKVANSIAAACPMDMAGKGVAARDACADNLAKSGALQAVSHDSLVWGASANRDYEPSHNKLTRLDALVWRKLYLSLFAFSGSYAVEPQPNGDQLLRLDAGIRPIAPEEFPYPFWHSADKWRDYQQSRQVGLLFRGGKLIAAYRNAELDPTKQFAAKNWDGKWTWEVDGQAGPRVALYTYVLSKNNPERRRLETAYRAFEAESRPYLCTSCHNPANPAGINPLVFFTHPGQALVARHDIVKQLEANKMPPPNGITSNAARAKLIQKARAFSAAGDRALAYERRLAR